MTNNWRLRSGVAALRIQDIYLLVADRDARRSCGFMRRINEAGALIWNLMADGRSREEIIAAMRQEYEFPEDEDPETDLDLFIQDLRDNDYLVCEDVVHEIQGSSGNS